MGKLLGGILTAVGMLLWYYGGTGGITTLVNLGLGAIVLGLVVAALPLGGQVDRNVLPLVCTPSCEFFGSIQRDLELEGEPVIIPPYENLPRGAVFLPKAKDFSIHLGRFDEGSVLVAGSERESGVLINPPSGWEIVSYTLENVGELAGTGVGYASSAVSSVLSALGLGSAEVFEREDGRIEVFVRPLCEGPVYADPVSSAVLLGVAIGAGELMKVSSVEQRKDHVKIVLERLGGVEQWL